MVLPRPLADSTNNDSGLSVIDGFGSGDVEQLLHLSTFTPNNGHAIAARLRVFHPVSFQVGHDVADGAYISGVIVGDFQLAVPSGELFLKSHD